MYITYQWCAVDPSEQPHRQPRLTPIMHRQGRVVHHLVGPRDGHGHRAGDALLCAHDRKGEEDVCLEEEGGEVGVCTCCRMCP